MRSLLFILLLIVAGCKSDDKDSIGKNNSDFVMYGLMIAKYSNSTEIIQQEIYNIVNDFGLSKNQNAKKYDSLTHEYKLYLERLNDTISDLVFDGFETEYIGEISNSSHTNLLFFKDDGYSELGKVYLQKREVYKNEILKLVQRTDLVKKIQQTLGTENEVERDGKSVDYLNFYFKNKPPISIIFYNHYTQYSILEFENDFMKNIILESR